MSRPSSSPPSNRAKTTSDKKPSKRSSLSTITTATKSDTTTVSVASKSNKNNSGYNIARKSPDKIDIQIISELLKNADIGSSDLSKKIGIPLSTIQRRRARIENSLLKKEYNLDFMAFGARAGDLVIDVDKGRSKEISQTLLEKYKQNILSCSIRINSKHNVIAHTVYKDSRDLHNLIESIRAMEYVVNVQWSEVVEEVVEKGNNNNKFEVLMALVAPNNL